ncbi:MAG: stage II sporulation protein M [Aurantibacter sp.]
MGKSTIFILSITTFCMGCAIPCFIDFDLSWFEPVNADPSGNPLLSMHKRDIFMMILKNNLTVVTTSIMGGLSFGLLTFANTLFNGFMLGVVVKSFLKSFEVSYMIKAFAPHSIEFLGIIIACYLGYRVAIVFYEYCFRDKQVQSKEMMHMLKTTLICLSIILTAAYLEAYVTIN